MRAYVLGAALYLPEEWLTDVARERARIPKTVRFQEKWRQALTLLREVRASGFTVTGVLADAEFGDVGLFRAFLHRLRLAYAVGISSNVTVFLGSPDLVWRTRNSRGRPRKHPELVGPPRPSQSARSWPPPGSVGSTSVGAIVATRDAGPSNVLRFA